MEIYFFSIFLQNEPMKYILIFLSLVLGYKSAAQTQEPYKVYDFSSVDLHSLDKNGIVRQLDSIYRNSGYDSLLQLHSQIRSATYTRRYMAFNIGYQASFASLSNLNIGLKPFGFNEISETFSGVPWGVDLRGKRVLFSYLLIPGIKNSAQNSDYKIELRSISMELAVGYDILNLKRLHFYPQLSLGFQDLDIEMIRKSATTDIINESEMVMQPAGTRLEKRSLMLSYGGELDYHLLYTPAGGGIILGLRYGLTSILSNGKFKINEKPSAYSSSDKICESFFSAVIKIYVKRE
jgi:hypothetical protein